MTVESVVRGCGLASCAFGLLRCPDVVKGLLAKWGQGDWTARLKDPRDAILQMSSAFRDNHGYVLGWRLLRSSQPIRMHVSVCMILL